MHLSRETHIDITVDVLLLLREKFLRRVQTLCIALRNMRNSPVHSNAVINYAIMIRLFRSVLRDRLKNFSSNNSETWCSMRSYSQCPRESCSSSYNHTNKIVGFLFLPYYWHDWCWCPHKSLTNSIRDDRLLNSIP